MGRILTTVVCGVGLDGLKRAFQIWFILETQVQRRKVQGTFWRKKMPVWLPWVVRVGQRGAKETRLWSPYGPSANFHQQSSTDEQAFLLSDLPQVTGDPFSGVGLL